MVDSYWYWHQSQLALASTLPFCSHECIAFFFLNLAVVRPAFDLCCCSYRVFSPPRCVLRCRFHRFHGTTRLEYRHSIPRIQRTLVQMPHFRCKVARVFTLSVLCFVTTPWPAFATPSVQQCNFVENTDYDTTAGSTHKGVASKEECCGLCIHAQGTAVDCRAAVFDPSDNTCYLKGGSIKAKAKSGVVGCVPANLPPAPAPAPEFNCSKPDANCASRLAATHWNPCYFINSSLPSLIDGAMEASSTSFSSIVWSVCLSHCLSDCLSVCLSIFVLAMNAGDQNGFPDNQGGRV